MPSYLRGPLRPAPATTVDSRHDFEAAVRPHLDCLHAAARRVLGRDDLAHDAVQDAMLRLWNLGAELPEAEPEARKVLMAFVVPTSRHLRRTEHRRGRNELAGGDARGPSPHGDHCEDPACIAERRDLEERLRIAIAVLPAPEREVLRLRAEHDLSHEAIARRLGLPLGTVKSRLHRARRLLANSRLASGLEAAS